MNIISVDNKNIKIIQEFHVGEAKQTKKSNIFATMGSMYFRLTLPFDLSWGQIEVWQKFFGLNLSNKVWTMPVYELWCSPSHYWMRNQLFQGTLVSNAAPCTVPLFSILCTILAWIEPHYWIQPHPMQSSAFCWLLYTSAY